MLFSYLGIEGTTSRLSAKLIRSVPKSAAEVSAIVSNSPPVFLIASKSTPPSAVRNGLVATAPSVVGAEGSSGVSVTPVGAGSSGKA